MKRVFLLLCALICFGCAPAPADPLAYQIEAASLRLSGTIGDLAFAADLTLGALSSTENIDSRDFSLTYTAPAALCGLTLTRSNGQTALTRGTLALSVPAERWSAMAAPAELFCIDCVIREAVVVTQNGTTLNRITAADDEGSYVLWLDKEGFPRRIEASLGSRTISADICRADAEPSPT